jgi:hypothetical protein
MENDYRFGEHEDKSSAFYLISKHLGLFGDDEIRTSPQLRDYLIIVWGKAPKNCHKLDVVETVAHKLGVEGARKLVELFPTKPKSKRIKRLISPQEIVRLKDEGKNFSDIAVVAGVSREQVRQIYYKEQKRLQNL